jgi:hypothetical protein
MSPPAVRVAAVVMTDMLCIFILLYRALPSSDDFIDYISLTRLRYNYKV